jgi:hypothetical protein
MSSADVERLKARIHERLPADSDRAHLSHCFSLRAGSMGRAGGRDTSSHRLILDTKGRRLTHVRDQRRRRPMSGGRPNGDRLLHFVAVSAVKFEETL